MNLQIFLHFYFVGKTCPPDSLILQYFRQFQKLCHFEGDRLRGWIIREAVEVGSVDSYPLGAEDICLEVVAYHQRCVLFGL